MRKSICTCAISFIVFAAGCGMNDMPVIEQFTVPERVEPGGRVVFEVVAHDDDNDVLTYTWTVGDTNLDAATPTVQWRAPEAEGTVVVEVRVSDGENDPAIRQKVLTVGKSQSEIPEPVPIEVPEVVPKVDVSKHSVPLDQVYFDTFQPINRAVPLSKASPELIERLRDAIRPINNPVYQSAVEATWLDDKEMVLGYAADNQAWAYPVSMLNFHEIVNDTLAGEPVLISYCPLCASGIVFSRELGNRILTFGNTSALYESDMVMLDYQTGSYWWQVAGEAIVGTLTGETLTVLPSMMTRWGEWKRLHPETLVVSSPRHSSNPFDSYVESINRGRFAFPVSDAGRDARLPAAARVLAVKVRNDVRGYPVEQLGRAAIMDTVGGENIVVFTDADGPAGAAYKPITVNRKLTFETRNGRFTDQETNSIWNLAGRAIDGPLKAMQLSPVPSKTTFWFAIVAADPEITVYQGRR